MKEKNDRQIKGVWIPIEIWESKSLSILEKFLIAEIDCLSSQERGCYATNKYLAELLGCTKGHIANMVSRLSGEYLVVSVIDGYKRDIRIANKSRWVHPTMMGGSSYNDGGVHHRMNGGSSQDDNNTGEITKEKEEGSICPAIAEPPAPPELPQPLKEKKNARNSDERAAAVRIVSYLNERARRNFSVGDKMSKTYLNVIIARLRDGITEEQMRMVVDNRCSAWLGDATMSEYLRPNTLFTPKNFANYLESATRSGIGVPVESLLDEPLNDEARYNSWAGRMKRDYPKTNTEVRFFRASEFNAFFAERPEWCPVIWEKWSPDLLQKKFKTALRLLEESQSKAKLAPEGLFDYLKTWFKDEYDGKH